MEDTSLFMDLGTAMVRSRQGGSYLPPERLAAHAALTDWPLFACDAGNIRIL